MILDLPLHQFIFAGMLRRIGEAATSGVELKDETSRAESMI